MIDKTRLAVLALALVTVVVAAPIIGATAASATGTAMESVNHQETPESDDPWWGSADNRTNGTYHYGPQSWENGTYHYGQQPGYMYGPMVGWGYATQNWTQQAPRGYWDNAPAAPQGQPGFHQHPAFGNGPMGPGFGYGPMGPGVGPMMPGHGYGHMGPGAYGYSKAPGTPGYGYGPCGPMMGWGYGPASGQVNPDGSGTDATRSGQSSSGYGSHGPQDGGHGGGHMGGW